MRAVTAQPLRRDTEAGLVAGVCAGISRRLGIDPIIFRVAFGAATLLYLFKVVLLFWASSLVFVLVVLAGVCAAAGLSIVIAEQNLEWLPGSTSRTLEIESGRMRRAVELAT